MQKIITAVAIVVSLGSINTVFADTQQPLNANAASANAPQQTSTTTNVTSTPDQVLTGSAPTTPASNQGTLAHEHNLSDEEMD